MATPRTLAAWNLGELHLPVPHALHLSEKKKKNRPAAPSGHVFPEGSLRRSDGCFCR